MSAAAAPPPAPAARRPAALGPIVRLTVKGLLGRRRTLGVALLAVAPVFVAAILAFAGGLGNPDSLALEVFGTLTLGLVAPLVALVLGTGALGTEIDDGTVVYLVLKPVSRRIVVLAKMLVAAAATSVLVVPAAAVSGFLLLGTGNPGLLLGTILATLLASVLYAVAFVALSVFTGRALIIGLGYVLVWEGLVTSLLAGTRVLSIREYALSVAVALGGESTAGPEDQGVALPTALVLSVAVLVLAYVLGSWRLGRFEVTDTG